MKNQNFTIIINFTKKSKKKYTKQKTEIKTIQLRDISIHAIATLFIEK